jgi:hypothetical protein
MTRIKCAAPDCNNLPRTGSDLCRTHAPALSNTKHTPDPLTVAEGQIHALAELRSDLINARDTARAQRDDLLAALRAIADMSLDFDTNLGEVVALQIAIARAAIANATKE